MGSDVLNIREVLISSRVFLGRFIDTFKTGNGLIAQLYMNAPSSDLKDGYRGVIMKNGDIYTVGSVDPDEEEYVHMRMTHNGIHDGIHHSGKPLYDYSDFKNILNVQLESGVWLLGESYLKTELKELMKSKDARKIADNFKRRNPDKKLRLKPIFESGL